MVAQYMNPAPQTQLQNPQQNASYEEMHKGWMDYFTHPTTRAMLMQFGLGMLSPMAPGQTFGGHFAMAAGDAGMAGARAQEQAINQQQADTQTMQAERQAAASERAAAAEEGRLGVAQEGLGIEREGQKITQAKNIADADAEQRRLDIAQQQANQLGGYYGALAKAGEVKAAPPGYEAAVKAATTSVLEQLMLNDDPEVTFGTLFDPIKKDIDAQFGITGASPTTDTPPPAPGAAAAGAPPTPGGPTAWPGMEKAMVGQQYIFANGAVGEYISPGQVRIIKAPGEAAAPLDSGAMQ